MIQVPRTSDTQRPKHQVPRTSVTLQPRGLNHAKAPLARYGSFYQAIYLSARSTVSCDWCRLQGSLIEGFAALGADLRLLRLLRLPCQQALDALHRDLALPDAPGWPLLPSARN